LLSLFLSKCLLISVLLKILVQTWSTVMAFRFVCPSIIAFSIFLLQPTCSLKSIVVYHAS
jgi:hypothetical protein